jgi:hypothetical protein
LLHICKKEFVMKRIALSFVVLAGLSSLALASQRGNDPATTLTGKALGTGGTGSGNTSVTGSANAYGLAVEPRYIKRNRASGDRNDYRMKNPDFYTD